MNVRGTKIKMDN